jgi:hypothetical protein
MKILLFIASLFLYSTAVHAEGFTVFSVKTDFPMSDGQTHFRDVYVNMGTSQGIKPGSKLDAYRVLTTVDEINQKTGRNISFKIARLKVIHAEPDMAVARVIEFLPPESTPIGTYTNVMVGDRVDASVR